MTTIIKFGIILFFAMIASFLSGCFCIIAITYINNDRPPITNSSVINCPEGYTVIKAENDNTILCVSPEHICEYYISCPDSNYEIKCPSKPVIKIKNPDIGGWE